MGERGKEGKRPPFSLILLTQWRNAGGPAKHFNGGFTNVVLTWVKGGREGKKKRGGDNTFTVRKGGASPYSTC